jgi:hypothetical protein
MNFTLFESLTTEQAQDFIKHYLTLEAKAIVDMSCEAQDQGMKCDFSIGSISSFFGWISSKLATIPVEHNSSVPLWIRETDSYQEGLKTFDERSKVLVVRASYYLGETFCRSFESLSWGIGSCEIAEQNMPVITGFHSGFEMAPMLIAENLLLRIVADGESSAVVDRAVEAWVNRI